MSTIWRNHVGNFFKDRLRKGIANALALILCLSLFCAFLPMTVMAEGEEEVSVPEAEDIAQSEPEAPAGKAEPDFCVRHLPAHGVYAVRLHQSVPVLLRSQGLHPGHHGAGTGDHQRDHCVLLYVYLQIL